MAVFESPFLKPSPQNRWAAVLEAISKGLGDIGKMRQAREEVESRESHEDAREAARNAFAENLARFQAGKESERTDKIIAGENTREQTRLTAEEERARQDRELRSHEHEDQMKVEHERTGMEGTRLKIEQQRADAETKRADRADAAQADHDKRDQENARKNRAVQAQASAKENLRSLMDQRKDIETDLRKPEMNIDPAEKAARQKSLDDLDKQISATRRDIDALGTAAGFEPESSRKASSDAASKLPPDRQQLFKDLQQQFPDQPSSTLLQRAKEAPQKAVDAAMQLRPTASTDTGGATGGNDFMPQSDKGASNVAQASDQNDVLNAAEPQGADQKAIQTIQSGGAQLADSGAAASAATPGDQSVADTFMQQPQNADNSGVPAPPGGEQEVPPTTSDQQNQDQQFQQFGQQLEQSPEGQGVHTTLDRLAQSTNPVQADKLRRQAELQIGDIDDQIDPNSYIDWYMQQQQQEPEYS